MPFEQFRYLTLNWLDIVEILVVAYVIYRLLMFLVGTRALQILIGLISLGLIYFIAAQLNLNMIVTLLGLVFTYGIFAAIVLFQPELRHALSQLGRTRAVQFFTGASQSAAAEAVTEAAERLSRTGTGALIAVEGEVSLTDYVDTGIPLSATVSADLLATIFTPYSPLHDGAVIIRGDHIIGAGCVLPLTQYPVADRSLGTRHRAALGLSDESDATVVVVSEETAKMSIAMRGILHRGVTPQQIREVLTGGEHPILARTSGPSKAATP